MHVLLLLQSVSSMPGDWLYFIVDCSTYKLQSLFLCRSYIRWQLDSATWREVLMRINRHLPTSEHKGGVVATGVWSWRWQWWRRDVERLGSARAPWGSSCARAAARRRRPRPLPLRTRSSPARTRTSTGMRTDTTPTDMPVSIALYTCFEDGIFSNQRPSSFVTFTQVRTLAKRRGEEKWCVLIETRENWVPLRLWLYKYTHRASSGRRIENVPSMAPWIHISSLFALVWLESQDSTSKLTLTFFLGIFFYFRPSNLYYIMK